MRRRNSNDSRHRMISVYHHAADAFALVHQIEALVDVSERHGVRDQGSISILPSMYQSTIFGTSVRPRAPPNAVPFHTRPVTSWKGRVAISAPAGATPMMMDCPQPRWLASNAWRMTVTLPVQSKV